MQISTRNILSGLGLGLMALVLVCASIVSGCGTAPTQSIQSDTANDSRPVNGDDIKNPRDNFQLPPE